MTKKDYVLLAKALKQAKPTQKVFGGNLAAATEAWDATVCQVSDALSYDNERFDETEFMTASGLFDCDHKWQEQPGEPPVDVCSSCGESRS